MWLNTAMAMPQAKTFCSYAHDNITKLKLSCSDFLSKSKHITRHKYSLIRKKNILTYSSNNIQYTRSVHNK